MDAVVSEESMDAEEFYRSFVASRARLRRKAAMIWTSCLLATAATVVSLCYGFFLGWLFLPALVFPPAFMRRFTSRLRTVTLFIGLSWLPMLGYVFVFSCVSFATRLPGVDAALLAGTAAALLTAVATLICIVQITRLQVLLPTHRLDEAAAAHTQPAPEVLAFKDAEPGAASLTVGADRPTVLVCSPREGAPPRVACVGSPFMP
eukprot:gnl/Chilomastix_cuspidata/692.p3 GENE.gnl/Chilomastix_cuspidata/692~~gnl/Chilomastix_cuspidata/692.p3  ORF type:complete len:205 (-),score=64.45 gnl/Chilomastix_cuspidata/692:350-964(-)